MIPSSVAVIWWVALLAALFVVFPLTWYLLHRLLAAARNIERYAAEALAAGGGTAANTSAIPALETTIGVATQILTGAGAIANSTGAIERVLSDQKLGGGQP